MQHTHTSPTNEVQFNAEDLDQSILESGVTTSLSSETQRAIAAYSMIVFALAMSVRDDSQYRHAIDEVSGVPVEEQEVQFFAEFGQVLIRDIANDFSFAGMDLSAFTERAQYIVQHAGAQCH